MWICIVVKNMKGPIFGDRHNDSPVELKAELPGTHWSASSILLSNHRKREKMKNIETTAILYRNVEQL